MRAYFLSVFASSEQLGGYPIEVAIAAGEWSKRWLIRPTLEWQLGGLWDRKCGVSFDLCMSRGMPAHVVWTFLQRRLLCADVFSEDSDRDQAWLDVLSSAAGFPSTVAVKPVTWLYEELVAPLRSARDWRTARRLLDAPTLDYEPTYAATVAKAAARKAAWIKEQMISLQDLGPDIIV